MKSLKKVGAMLLAVTMLVPLVACGGANKANTAEKPDPNAEATPVLRVGMECGYAPYNWTQQDDSNGAVKIDESNEFAGGYDVEIAKKVAEGLGRELVIVKTQWDGLPPAVQSDKIDVIMAGMSPTAARAEQIDFTAPYWVSDYVMIVQKGSKYENATSLEDFAGAKITGQLNTVHYDILDQIKGVDKQEAMEDFPQMRVALQSGVIDGYIAEVPESMSIEMAMPDLVSVHFDEGKGFEVKDNENTIAAGLKKGSELKGEIDEILNALTEEDRQELMTQAVKNQPAAN
ncbi:amino acid ABC transporter substrate-binding protein, PAAT family [Anaerosphaera aminiphila DSM 21120]|uniref:Amino acid ABC transporter substrate-binding protein, PAAT family n=1 Tax=Anaerosphaera aminiphila DSM 21120 TaxID=1120995 RepID=A0A1M5T7X5_9FIRM|nr:transporter substrate-binding domain-containing protein [Anaerosphaera aminiphila]SHH46824.1 amino acid ABC transporter substrate-binding protein, PAAT family [Anaerosphaera aminiphila DSM 21120]